MREILCRGKRLDNGKGVLSPWIEGHYFQTPLTEESVIGAQASDGMFFLTGKKRHVIEKNGCVYEIDPETLGEFIGVRAKDGRRIFEGDIVTAWSQGSTGSFTIKLREDGGNSPVWLLWPAWKEGQFWTIAASREQDGVVYDRGLEIIGNIHDE